MSTFLQICQDTRQEAGLSGTGPSSVDGQVGMDKKIVDWVRNSWVYIQESQRNWRFMWKGDGTYTCVPSVREFSPESLGFSVRNLILTSVTCRASGTQIRLPLSYMDYTSFKNQILNLTPVQGRPTHFTWTPDNKVMLHPVPSQEFVIEFEYYRTPQELSANTDVPIMPSRYHRLITLIALTRYGAHDDFIGVYQDSKIEASKMLDALHADQLESVVMAGALA